MGHRLASKDKLTIEDLNGEDMMINRRIWNNRIGELRKTLLQHNSNINIMEFEFYDVNIFNKCENENTVLLTFDAWKNVHPLLKILPVEWEYTVPFGLFYAPSPTKTVRKFLSAVQTVLDLPSNSEL